MSSSHLDLGIFQNIGLVILVEHIHVQAGNWLDSPVLHFESSFWNNFLDMTFRLSVN